jgi:F-type H+-transporting ATPase subunit epsilon
MALQVTITTPEGLVHRGEARKVIVPAFDGEMGFLPHHAPLVATLGAGELRVTPADGAGVLSFFAAGGFVQVVRDRVVVLATQAEPAAHLESMAAEEDLKAIHAEAVPPDPAARGLRAERIGIAQARARLARKGRGGQA